MVVNLDKPLRARIYDADTSWYDTNCIDVDVQQIVLAHPPYTHQVEILYSGGRSQSFEFLPQISI